MPQSNFSKLAYFLKI